VHRRIVRRPALVVSSTLALSLLFACGSDDSGGSSSGGGSGGATGGASSGGASGSGGSATGGASSGGAAGSATGGQAGSGTGGASGGSGGSSGGSGGSGGASGGSGGAGTGGAAGQWKCNNNTAGCNCQLDGIYADTTCKGTFSCCYTYEAATFKYCGCNNDNATTCETMRKAMNGTKVTKCPP